MTIKEMKSIEHEPIVIKIKVKNEGNNAEVDKRMRVTGCLRCPFAVLNTDIIDPEDYIEDREAEDCRLMGIYEWGCEFKHDIFNYDLENDPQADKYDKYPEGHPNTGDYKYWFTSGIITINGVFNASCPLLKESK